MSKEKVVKTIKNFTIPKGVVIFPNIDIEIAEVASTNYIIPSTITHVMMTSWIPIIRDSVYLIPLVHRTQDKYENKEELLKTTKAQFLAEARQIVENYIIDDDSITKIESYGWYLENMYYKMDYGI